MTERLGIDDIANATDAVQAIDSLTGFLYESLPELREKLVSVADDDTEAAGLLAMLETSLHGLKVAAELSCSEAAILESSAEGSLSPDTANLFPQAGEATQDVIGSITYQSQFGR